MHECVCAYTCVVKPVCGLWKPHLSSCNTLRFPCLLFSSMGYVLNMMRPRKMRTTGAGATSIFRVKFTKSG